MRPRRGLCAALLLVAIIAAPSATGAEEADLSEIHSFTFIPQAAELGELWYMSNSGQLPDDDADVGSVQLAQFTGPGGARAYLVVAEVGSGPRATWQVIHQGWFAYFKGQISEDTLSEGGSSQIEGCDEAIYASGSELFYVMNVGVTQCAMGDHFVLVAMVSGSLNNERGSRASGSLISAALEHAGVVSPSATPTP